MTSSYKTPLPEFVTVFFDEMDNFPDEYGDDIWKLRNMIDRTFRTEDLDVRLDLAEKYLSLQTYFPYDLLPYQICALCLWMCVFDKETDLPRWPDLMIMGGRGLGKDGIIAYSAFALTSPYNPAESYDVDICANNEEQAVRPLKDVLEVLENADNTNKLKRFYYWTKEVIKGRQNRGEIKGRTNNPKGKDGMRSGCVVFNEFHQYENYKNISVFTTGLGKKKHPRTLIVTTNGDVVGGPLDDYMKNADEILSGQASDDGFLPFIFRLTKEKDIMNPDKWYIANPRLKHSPELLHEYQKEFKAYKRDPDKNASFATKRMNFRKTNREIQVTKWENLDPGTTKPLIDLTGHECTIGVDYSKLCDWAAVNIHFKIGDDRYDINHAFVCTQGPDFPKLNCPHEQWEKMGLLTYVDAEEINPNLIKDYIARAKEKYRVKMLDLDQFRFTLLASVVAELGFSLKNKNLKLIRPSDIQRVVPLIDSCFNNHYFHWGDQPVLRWSTNNTKLVPSKKSVLAKDGENDIGNYLYGKIERIKRKTDPFMALAASMVSEDQLSDFAPTSARSRVGVITW